jgi:hypothetical protein
VKCVPLGLDTIIRSNEGMFLSLLRLLSRIIHSCYVTMMPLLSSLRLKFLLEVDFRCRSRMLGNETIKNMSMTIYYEIFRREDSATSYH